MAQTAKKIQDCSTLSVTLAEEAWGAGITPGEPGWMFIKFLCDNLPSERMALVSLLDAEPNGAGIKYAQRNGKGWFSSDASFTREHGFSFEVGHADYKLDRLEEWFMNTTDGCWDDIFWPPAPKPTACRQARSIQR